MVRSVKVSSLRDSVPVRTAVPLRTGSFTAAGRGAACCGSSFTSFTIWVTCASFSSAACIEIANKMRQEKIDVVMVNFEGMIFPTRFFIYSVRGLRTRRGLVLVRAGRLRRNKTNQGAPPEDDQIRGDVGALACQVTLLLFFAFDQIPAG